MARAAGRVDQAHLTEAKRMDGRGEGAVEDEALDELWRLQQGVALSGGLGEVLIEVAEEAGVPFAVGEVVAQGACVRVYLQPELTQRHGGIRTDREAEDRVVGGVEEGLQAGQRAGFTEGFEQVAAVVVRGVGAQPRLEAVDGQSSAARFRAAREPRPINEAVVFDEAQEDT